MKKKGYYVEDPRIKKDRYLATNWGRMSDTLKHSLKGNSTVVFSKASAQARLNQVVNTKRKKVEEIEAALLLKGKAWQECWCSTYQSKLKWKKELEEYYLELKKAERLVIKEGMFNVQVKPKRPPFNFDGSIKFEYDTAKTSRKNCGCCGGTIFEGTKFLHAEYPGAYTIALCPFCIISYGKFAEQEIAKIPDELKEPFMEKHGGFTNVLAEMI